MSKPRVYPLEVVTMYELEAGREPMAYYSRGWHDLPSFWLELWCLFYFERHELLDFTQARVQTGYMRFVPFDDQGQMWAQFPSKPGPGAFKVTYTDAQCWPKGAWRPL